MAIKKFSEYIKLDEASLRGNKGVSDEFLRRTEDSAKRANDLFKMNRPEDLNNLMNYIRETSRIQERYKRQLETIATETIRNYYGSILDDVNLVIKFDNGRDIQNTMEDVPMDTPSSFKRIEDEDTIAEIDKRKILKNLMQGEAKNSKLMLNLPEVRDSITELMGEQQGTRYLELLNKITDIASFFDWEIPVEIQREMWERNKGGFAGSVDIKWEDSPSDEELAQKILDELEKKEGELPEETGDLFSEVTPTIYATGKDFAMLLHEAIKGIYGLIIALSIPEDPELSEKVIMNTDTLADELEDLRYGPKFAADLRDAINKFPESDEIANLREHVVGKLSLMPAKEFLNFMLMFVNGEKGAEKILKAKIDEVKQDFSDYADSNNPYKGDYETEENVIDDIESNTESESEIQDVSKLSQPEILKLIDAALDRGDQKEYYRLSKYLKESRNYKRTKKARK